ncbi:MAG TPA: hypothetical protein VGF79_14385, partial [Bacteroidia bacterium]
MRKLDYLPKEPFRGLSSFRYQDRHIFAGRDNEIKELMNYTSLYKGFLTYGVSGIGKSSLISSG